MHSFIRVGSSRTGGSCVQAALYSTTSDLGTMHRPCTLFGLHDIILQIILVVSLLLSTEDKDESPAFDCSISVSLQLWPFFLTTFS